jgi:hypothetical protein
MADDLSARLRLTRTPDVRVSDEIDTPLATGVRRPTIVLPADRFARLSVHQQRMVICHELAHVRRKDLALGCVPALAERLFFFHPLAHVAAREYALCREAACDEVVLKVLDAPPQEYGRLLLNLGVRPRMRLAAAGAPWSFPNLKRRLVMLSNSAAPSTMSRILAGGAICLSAIALVPVQLVGRSQAAAQEPAVAPAAEASARIRAAVEAEVSAVTTAAEEATAEAVVAAAEEVEAVLAVEAVENVSDDSSFTRDPFILLGDDDHTTWHGSSRDHARAIRHKREGEPLLWFRRDGQEYVVRDRALIAQAEAVWKTVGELGGAQGELGGEMGKLGSKQGEHGSRMGELGSKQGALGAKLGELAVRQAELALRQTRELTDQEQELLEKQEREIEIQMETLQKEMEGLGEQMEALAKPMEDLGTQMEPLAKQMEALGKKMEEAARSAEAEMEKLIERAVEDGSAEKVE